MKKKYEIKKTEALIQQLVPYWRMQENAWLEFTHLLSLIETSMQHKTFIKDIEFIWCDNEIVGIGNADRTIELIHDYELDDVHKKLNNDKK